jgi:hypothetical protein
MHRETRRANGEKDVAGPKTEIGAISDEVGRADIGLEMR